MEKKYAFVLGNNAALSIAEVTSVLKRKRINFELIGNSKEILLISSDKLDEDFLEGLGGTIKIIDIFSELDSPSIEDITDAMFAKLSSGAYTDGKNKYHFGISIYDLNGSNRKIRLFTWSLKKIYLKLKKEAKKEQLNLAYPNIKERSLSSASVLKNKLLGDDGAEFSLTVTGEGTMLGKTVAVQDIDFYSHIDFGRPVRDVVSGTTPPKLATIMINLAEASEDAVLLDPFCGSGTFIQQMLLAGYKNVYGSDISSKAMADTEKNLNWLKKEFPDLDTGSNAKSSDSVILVFDSEAQTRGATSRSPESNLFISDVAEISKKIDQKVDAIVSETYLGPPLKKEPTEKELKKTVDLLTDIYGLAFREFGKILNKDGRIVLAIPIFRIRNKNVYIPVENILERNGFRIVDLCKGIEGLSKEQKSPRKTFIYSRPDQLVRREIMVLEYIKK